MVDREGGVGACKDADKVSLEGLDSSFCRVCVLVVRGYKVVGHGLGCEEI